MRTSSSGYTAHTEDHICKAVAHPNLKEDGGVVVDTYFMIDDKRERITIELRLKQGNSPISNRLPLEMLGQR